MVQVKICGLTEPHGLTAAIEGGADFVGFVFHPASPRYVAPDVAAYLASYVPERTKKVGLFVNPDIAQVQQILQDVSLDIIQLHGNEPVEFIKELKIKTGLPIIKAVNVAAKNDLAAVPAYADVAQWILFDAKTDKGAGGTGESFDWHILKDYPHKKPWMLAGGLNAGNIHAALSVLTPDAVDISSGVESARGVKDQAKIHEFLNLAKSAGKR
jgi:phosphoribosylanthranilate isomerase